MKIETGDIFYKYVTVHDKTGNWFYMDDKMENCPRLPNCHVERWTYFRDINEDILTQKAKSVGEKWKIYHYNVHN